MVGWKKELIKRCKENGVKMSKGKLDVIIEQLVDTIKDTVDDGEIVRIKNFMTFYQGETVDRKLPDGSEFEPRYVIRTRMSNNFKN